MLRAFSIWSRSPVRRPKLVGITSWPDVVVTSFENPSGERTCDANVSAVSIGGCSPDGGFSFLLQDKMEIGSSNIVSSAATRGRSTTPPSLLNLRCDLSDKIARRYFAGDELSHCS